MSLPLVVNGITFLFPQNRDSPSWGNEVTDWATAVTAALNNVAGAGDIVQTAAVINNGQSSPINVTGLSFDAGTVRGAIVEYTVYRNTTGSGATERVEVGTLYLAYKTVAATWELTQQYGSGPSGVTFSINSSGQVVYTSDTQTGSSHTGTVHFRARAFSQ